MTDPASPSAGSARRREIALVVHGTVIDNYCGLRGYRTCDVCVRVTAALARVEADTKERAAKAICYGCRDGLAMKWRTGLFRDLVHVYADGLVFGHCAAQAILASEPVAGEARPSGPREA